MRVLIKWTGRESAFQGWNSRLLLVQSYKFKMKWCYAEAEFRKSGWCPFMQNPFPSESTAIAVSVSANFKKLTCHRTYVFPRTYFFAFRVLLWTRCPFTVQRSYESIFTVHIYIFFFFVFFFVSFWKEENIIHSDRGTSSSSKIGNWCEFRDGAPVRYTTRQSTLRP